MQQELKPCPFCGDDYIVLYLEYTTSRYFHAHEWKIGCQTIGCCGCHVYGHNFDTKKKAIEAWNRRAEVNNG